MSGLNRSIIAGRLVADPEVRYTRNETVVCHFALKVNGRDKIECVAWGGLAKVCGEYLSKGKLVAVEGRISIRSWKGKGDKASKGNTICRSTTEIIVDNMQMLDSKFYEANKKLKGGE